MMAKIDRGKNLKIPSYWDRGEKRPVTLSVWAAFFVTECVCVCVDNGGGGGVLLPETRAFQDGKQRSFTSIHYLKRRPTNKLLPL